MKIRNFAVTIALAACAAAAAPVDAQVYLSRVVSRGWLGITVDESITSSNGRETQSVVITGVLDDSPAKRAGVQAGDTLLRVNDFRATSELIRSLGSSVNPGDTVRFVVKRDGRERQIRIEAGEVPESDVMMQFRKFGPGEHGGMYYTLDPDSVRGMLRIFTDSMMKGFEGRNFGAFRMDSANGKLRELVFDSVFGSMMPSRAMEFHKLDSIFRPGVFMRDSLMLSFSVDSLGFAPKVFGLDERFGPGVGNGNIFMMTRNAFAGAELVDVEGGLGEYFGTKAGVLVLRVPERTPAAGAGLQPGDVIQKVDGSSVSSIRDLNAAVAKLRRGTPVKLQILRHEKTYSLELKRE